MREYSIRSSQLKELRIRFIIKELILLFSTTVLFLIPVLIQLGINIYSFFGGRFNNFLDYFTNKIFTIFIIIILFDLIFVPGFIFSLFVIKRDNKMFHNKYLEYIIEECRLNDIYYKFRKKSFDKSLYEELEEQLNIKDIKRIYELSDISSMRFIEFNQIQYLRNDEKYNGVLIVLRNNEPLDGFFQIRTRGEPIKTNYEGKAIQRFGFQNNIPNFEIFSSLGSSTYSLKNKDFESLMNKFKKFVRCNYVITRSSSTISIFLDTFQFNLTTGLYSSYHEKDFDMKVDAMIHLHELTIDIINSLLSLNI